MSVVSTVHNITRTVPGTLRMVGVEPCLSVHQTLSKCRPVVTRPTMTGDLLVCLSKSNLELCLTLKVLKPSLSFPHAMVLALTAYYETNNPSTWLGKN